MQSLPHPTDEARAPWVNRLVVAATLLACGIPLSVNYVDPDSWGHVQYAHDWLASGELPATATHTFTAVDHPWINHENLAELAMVFGYRHLGVSGVLTVKCLAGMGLLLLMIRRAASHRVSLLVICGWLLLVANGLHVFWLVRPQLATFVGLAAMVVLLDAAFANWQSTGRVRYGYLWAFLPVQWLWANSHGGFLAGLCLFSLYLVVRIVETRTRRDFHAPGTSRYLLAMIGAVVAISLVNPYGYQLHLWLLSALRTPRPEILEWRRPDLLSPLFWPFFGMLGLSLFAWTKSRRRHDWAHLALLMAAAVQALAHIRHIGLFVILAGFWMPEHLQSWAAQWVRRWRSAYRIAPSSWHRWVQALGAISAVAAAALFSVVAQRLTEFPVSRSQYPIDAVQFMADRHIQGRLLVSFNWAQYAIAALQPDVRVAFDGRFRTCYPQEVIDMHFDFLLGDEPGARYRGTQSGPIDGTRALRHGNPDLVLVDRSFPHSVRVMSRQRDFVLLYQDGVAQLWGRADRYDDRGRSTFIPLVQRPNSDRLPMGSVTWPALPERRYAVRYGGS